MKPAKKNKEYQHLLEEQILEMLAQEEEYAFDDEEEFYWPARG